MERRPAAAKARAVPAKSARRKITPLNKKEDVSNRALYFFVLSRSTGQKTIDEPQEDDVYSMRSQEQLSETFLDSSTVERPAVNR